MKVAISSRKGDTDLFRNRPISFIISEDRLGKWGEIITSSLLFLEEQGNRVGGPKTDESCDVLAQQGKEEVTGNIGCKRVGHFRDNLHVVCPVRGTNSLFHGAYRPSVFTN